LGFALYRFVPAVTSLPVVYQYALLVAICAVVGLSIEIVQMFTQRSANLYDILYDVSGGIAAVTLFSPQIGRLAGWRKGMLYLLMVSFLIPGMFAPLGYMFNVFSVRQSFPIINTFESQFEKLRWHGNAEINISNDRASEGSHSLKLAFKPASYAGAKLRQLHPDWSAYHYFLFDIYNNEKYAIKLTLSIYDQSDRNTRTNYFNRFNEKLVLQSGWNKIRIPIQEIHNAPLKRLLSLERIAGMMLYSMKLESPVTVYIDNIRLEN